MCNTLDVQTLIIVHCSGGELDFSRTPPVDCSEKLFVIRGLLLFQVYKSNILEPMYKCVRVMKDFYLIRSLLCLVRKGFRVYTTGGPVSFRDCTNTRSALVGRTRAVF